MLSDFHGILNREANQLFQLFSLHRVKDVIHAEVHKLRD
jgi:hypothetical protein